MKAINIIIWCIFLFLITGCNKNEPNIEPEPEPSTIEILTGDNQSAPIAEKLAIPISAVVKDQNGNEISGIQVKYNISEGFISDTLLITNEKGIVSAQWTLGITPGTQGLEISAFKNDSTQTPLHGSPITVNAIATSIADSNYPSIYSSLSEEELSIRRNTYFERNPFVRSSLNNFGFCKVGNRDVQFPFNSDTVHRNEVISKIEYFIIKNTEETGVKNIVNLEYESIKEMTLYTDSYTSHWYVNTKNQTIDTVEVLNSSIGFRLVNGEVIECANNWFPEIYIPENFNFSREKAKSVLVGKTVTHNGWSDTWDVTITQEDIKRAESIRLVIVPIESDEKMELRVAWEITLSQSPAYYWLYVDVMTGEVVKKSPTIIF